MFVPPLISTLVFGGISAYLARRRGKNPLFWFFIGFFFGLFGVLFLFLTDRVNPKAKKREKESPSTIDITPRIHPLYKDLCWHYLDSERKEQGPMSFDALCRAHQEGKIGRKSYVWNPRLDGWKFLEEFL